ncbi:uncharacterized protein LOC129582637 isoform X1 [Paramacrobiotus metropolitanus]|uniref:uncharacterized protein LOC129582637 isoform X1 n=1 Tax=Paramacrobiotus metropolitanus TaxID=2943436 RepID=UPI002445CBA4|nr:uncharacterized protein LOC129582637 isoform X1 [Paramacrobiotus metropolitanus]
MPETVTIPSEYQAEEKEPPFFDLFEKPRIPSLLNPGTIRCTNDPPCNNCNHCQLEQHAASFIACMQRISGTRQHEILMCFVDVMPIKTAVWTLDLLRLHVDTMTPGIDSIARELQQRTLRQSGATVTDAPPLADVHRLITSVEQTVDWFTRCDILNQQLFIMRCLLIQDYSQLLWFYKELKAAVVERLPPEPEKPAISAKGKTPIPSKSKAETPVAVVATPWLKEPVKPDVVFGNPNPSYKGHICLDLEGAGFVTLEERNVFCSKFEEFRLWKSEGSIPIAAVCPNSGLWGVYSKIHRNISIYDVATKQIVEAISVKPETTPVLRMAISRNASYIFVQASHFCVHIYQKTLPKFVFLKQISLDPENGINLLDTTPKDQLVLSSRSASIYIYQHENQFTEPSRIYTLGGNIWSHCSTPIFSLFFPTSSSSDIFAASLGSGSVVLVNTQTGCIRKLLTAHSLHPGPVRYLHCDTYFCIGCVHNVAYIWEINGSQSAARHTLPHPVEISASNALYQRLVTGCRDHSIRVWSVVTGQLLRVMVTFADVAHPLLKLDIIGERIIVGTMLTGLYVVWFEEVEWQESNPLIFACENESSDRCIRIEQKKILDQLTPSKPAETDSKWRQRLVRLLNHHAVLIASQPGNATTTHNLPLQSHPIPYTKPPLMETFTEEAAREIGKKGQAEEFAAQLSIRKQQSAKKSAMVNQNAGVLSETTRVQFSAAGERKAELLSYPNQAEELNTAVVAALNASNKATDQNKKNKTKATH